MPTLSIIRNVFAGILILTVFFTFDVKGQDLPQKEFSSIASQISRRTGNTYRLVRIGNNNIPSILAINSGAHLRILPESERNNAASVSKFARTEVQYVSDNALILPKSASLLETGTAKSGNLWLSSYIISYGGIPLRERSLKMNIGALSGKVMLIRNNIPSKLPNALSATISQDEIIRQATIQLGIHCEFKSSPQLVFIDEKENNLLRLCYEVTASDPDMNEMWRLTFDAGTGELVEKKSLLEHEGIYEEKIPSLPSSARTKFVPESHYDDPLGSISGMVLAKVHLHTPFDTLTTVGLPNVELTVNGVNTQTDSDGFWTLTSVQYPLTIQTSFNSRFFSVLRQDMIPNSSLTKTVTSGSADILWDDSNSNPTERDAFYSAAFAHLADKRIDTKLANIDLHMKVNINLNSVCNAYYIPADTSINFFVAGSGCSNTGQIADVVFHEYGHRVTNARYQQAAGQNTNIVDGSLSEGFADLNSAFIRDDPRIGIGFFGNNNRIIRSCENSKKWPRDINQDIHISGEIISGAFWDLRKLIGHDTAEHLFHFMEYQMPDGVGITDSASLEEAFANTLTATILTDDDDNNLSNGTPHLNEILSAFKLHNITLSNFMNLDLDKVKDQDTSVTSYKIMATASYSGIVGSVNKNSVKVFYSINNGLTYSSVSLQSVGNDVFEGAIAKVPTGTIVKYYSSAASTLAENDTIYNPLPAQAYSFLVGYRQFLFDDAEQDNGWSLNSPTDQATTGLWVRGKPQGTYSDPTPPIQYIQQDTDHTPFPGTMCYITGNGIDPSGANDPNFAGYDDVDNGATTLTTPAFDLSKLKAPFIRYWYYYSNDMGQNSGIPKWETDISNDNGATWKTMQLSTQSTNGASGFPQWTEFSFPVSDYLSPSSSVKIRFIASDYIGALVEAGVDDLEILDPIQPEASVGKVTYSDQLPYPNPIHRGEKLHFPQAGISMITLVDLVGRTIERCNLDNGSLTMPTNISPGIYFLEEQGQRYKIIVTE